MNTPCPKCASSIALRYENGVPLALCGGCRGIWISVRGLNACVTGDPDDASSGLLDAIAHAPIVAPAGAPMCCPGCQIPLRPRRVGRVTIDHCKPCAGIFLDQGELVGIAGQFQRHRVHGGQAASRGPVVSNETAELIKLLVNPWWE